jgi:genome maintenance exonuclease 1
MSITINPPFKYEPVPRVEVDGKRLYLTPDGMKVPSVTTVLSATKDKTHLIEWRKRVGDSEATRISTEAAGLGTLFHTHLENFILGKERPTGNNQVRALATSMADIIIANGLSQINEVWGMEIGLYYPELYAGTTDLIALYKGKPAILDYKTTSKPKKREWIDDYFLQMCAYAAAHNNVYGTDINQAVIFMVSRSGEYQEFIIEGDEFTHYAEMWTRRVAQYYQLNM